MKLEVKKALSAGIFKVDIKFKSYEVFEENLMEDFGTPELLIPVGEYSHPGTLPEGEELTETVEITEEIKVKLNNTLAVSYEVKVEDVIEANDTATPEEVVQICKNKCTVFVEVFKAKASEKMSNLRKMKTDFESSLNTPEVIKI